MSLSGIHVSLSDGVPQCTKFMKTISGGKYLWIIIL